MKIAAIGAVSFAVLSGINYLLEGGLGSILSACSKKEELEPVPEPPQRPMPSNAEIKQSIDDLLELGDELVYDNGMDHRAEVLGLASMIYRTLNEGRTLEQDNPVIKFMTNDEWTQKTSTPDNFNKRNVYGFSDRESENRELVVYVKGNVHVLEALQTVAHETGITHVRRAQDRKIVRSDYTNWDFSMQESAGYLLEAAFLRKMEEVGFGATRYANTEKNVSYIKQMLESYIWKNSEKDEYFDNEGQLKTDKMMDSDITLGKWYGPAMFALDPTLADVKKRIELRGRTIPEENMTLIRRLANMNPDDFPSHFKSFLNASTHGYVLDWTVQLLTSSARLNGNEPYPYPSLFFPIDLLP